LGTPSTEGLRIPEGLRSDLERHFAEDFSDVRVYVNPTVAGLGARAFACGSEVHFAPDPPDMETASGRWLLAHELAHVVQQRTGRVRQPAPGTVAGVRDAVLEAEANLAATLFVIAPGSPGVGSLRGGPAGRPSGRSRVIQPFPHPKKENNVDGKG